jgi:hypothetical protein
MRQAIMTIKINANVYSTGLLKNRVVELGLSEKADGMDMVEELKAL